MTREPYDQAHTLALLAEAGADSFALERARRALETREHADMHAAEDEAERRALEAEAPTTTTHTPGPWHIGTGNGTGSIFPDHGRLRLEAGGTTLYTIARVTTGYDPVEDTANARLIAAAPDLLNACREALDWWHSNPRNFSRPEPSWLADVRDAVRRATEGEGDGTRETLARLGILDTALGRG